MYIEFVIIYVLLIISIGIGIVNLIISLNNKRNEKPNATSRAVTFESVGHASVVDTINNEPHIMQASTSGNGVAFCTKCAHQFPGNEKFCPYCGTPRS